MSWPAPALPPTAPTGTAIAGPITSSAGAALTSGSPTTLSGNAYAPFTGITVGLYPGAVLTTTVTDSTGAFSVSVTVPTGSYTIVAAGMRTIGTVRYRSLAVTVSDPTFATAFATGRSIATKLTTGAVRSRFTLAR
jgi:hypothetical protein